MLIYGIRVVTTRDCKALDRKKATILTESKVR